MYEYISGKIVELGPSHAVVDNNGIGYLLQISLNTYSKLSDKQEISLYVTPIIREDSHTLFGFYDVSERALFKLLISVSGIGANTARMMLSTLSPHELQNAILTDNVNTIKSVKGIGLKTAQRVIIELKDKIVKSEDTVEIPLGKTGNAKNEALQALVMLGFSKSDVNRVIDKVLTKEPDISVEDLIKRSLKSL